MSRPLVYAAQAVVEATAPLMPEGTVLEVVVAKAIESGHVQAGARGGVVFLDQFGLVARVSRAPGKRRSRPLAWFVKEVSPKRNVESQRRSNATHDT